MEVSEGLMMQMLFALMWKYWRDCVSVRSEEV